MTTIARLKNDHNTMLLLHDGVYYIVHGPDKPPTNIGNMERLAALRAFVYDVTAPTGDDNVAVDESIRFAQIDHVMQTHWFLNLGEAMIHEITNCYADAISTICDGGQNFRNRQNAVRRARRQMKAIEDDAKSKMIARMFGPRVVHGLQTAMRKQRDRLN